MKSPYIIAGILLAITLAVAIDLFYERRRERGLERFALKAGYLFHGKSDADTLLIRESSFGEKGHRLFNVITGTMNTTPGRVTPFTYFEHQYGNGDSSSTESVLMLAGPHHVRSRSTRIDEDGIHIEKLNDKIFIWRQGKRCRVDDIKAFLLDCFRVYQGLLD